MVELLRLSMQRPRHKEIPIHRNDGYRLSEEQSETMTENLKPLIISRKGKYVEVKLRIVVEVGYQELQRSPNYESRTALRFPRMIRTREDKSPDECDTIQRITKLYKSQGKNFIKKKF